MMKHKTESHVGRTGIAAVLQASKWRLQENNGRRWPGHKSDSLPTGWANSDWRQRTCPYLRARWNPGLHSFQVKATQKRLSTSTRFPPVLMSKLTIIYPWRWGQVAKRLSGKVQWCECHWTVHIPGGSRTILGGRAGAAKDLRSGNRISVD